MTIPYDGEPLTKVWGDQLYTGDSAHVLSAITVSMQATAPANPNDGDIWFDSANGNQMKTWNGFSWVAITWGTAAITPAAVTPELIDFTARDIGGVTTSFGATPPGGAAPGDLWYDSSHGYQLNRYNGTSWVAVQFGTTAIANSSITAGKVDFTASDIGGVVVTMSATAPATPNVDDLWYDASNGYRLNQWSGTAWVAFRYGTNAIAAGSITASLIAAGTITATQLAAGTITAAQIATGTITATQIATNTITTNNIAANAITAALIAANTITAAQIAAGTITGDRISAGTITATNLSANSVTATQLAANAVTAAAIQAGSIQAGAIAANAITSSKIAAGTVVAGIVDSTTITGAHFLLYDASSNLVGQLVTDVPYVDMLGTLYHVPGLVIGKAGASQIEMIATPTGTVVGAGQILFNTNDGRMSSGSLIVNPATSDSSRSSLTIQTPMPFQTNGLVGNGSSYLTMTSTSKDGTTTSLLFMTVGSFDGTIHGLQFTPLRMEADVYSAGTATAHLLYSNTSGAPNPKTRLRIGNGPPGVYYYEEWGLSAQAIATGTQTTLINLTQNQLYSDYSNLSALFLSSGIWTCPADGIYTFTVSVSFATWSAGLLRVGVRRTPATPGPIFGTNSDNAAAQGLMSLTVKRWVPAGAFVDFVVQQNSGSSRTLNAYATNEASFISIYREQ